MVIDLSRTPQMFRQFNGNLSLAQNASDVVQVLVGTPSDVATGGLDATTGFPGYNGTFTLSAATVGLRGRVVISWASGHPTNAVAAATYEAFNAGTVYMTNGTFVTTGPSIGTSGGILRGRIANNATFGCTNTTVRLIGAVPTTEALIIGGDNSTCLLTLHKGSVVRATAPLSLPVNTILYSMVEWRNLQVIGTLPNQTQWFQHLSEWADETACCLARWTRHRESVDARVLDGYIARTVRSLADKFGVLSALLRRRRAHRVVGHSGQQC